MEQFQLHILLNTINDGASSSVDAEMINATLKVWNIGSDDWKLANPIFLAPHLECFGERFQQIPCDNGHNDHELFRQWKDIWSNGGHVLFHAFSRHLDNFLGQAYTAFSVHVFCFIDAIVGLAAGTLLADRMQQFVHGMATITPFIGENHGGSTASEQGVLEQKGTFISKVQIGCDDFGRHHQGLAPSGTPPLKHILGQINTHQRRSTSHTRQIVRQTVAPHVEFGHDHGTERGRRREEGAINDEDVNLLGRDLCFLERLVDNVENDNFCLLSASLDGSVRFLSFFQALDNAGGPGGGLSRAGAGEKTAHEIETVLRETLLSSHHFDNLLVRHLPFVGGLEGRKGHEEDGVVHPENPSHDHQHQDRHLDRRLQHGVTRIQMRDRAHRTFEQI
mmetsp:Transcript_8000/g.14412  ORF Transcript_8000/g.14412 Transcript_8000/m.14412 type:complete len:392 (-) Transcript_8000:500-1675(-)